jgi:hypothetical protein
VVTLKLATSAALPHYLRKKALAQNQVAAIPVSGDSVVCKKSYAHVYFPRLFTSI